ncbi:hypothetical protein [Pseudolysinimonas sp.]|uniref:hypothetical protein n=1 Tax=Pseudolysinimonas sp. TaxID=2680009 RepID=UPI003F7D7395
MPPTAQLFRKKHPRKAAWSEWDYLLIEAVQTLEAERCRCGLPIYICHSDDPHIRFRVEEDVCEATAAVDRHEDALKAKDKDYKPDPGTTLRPVPYTTDKSDFVDYRDRYYDAEKERRDAIMSSLVRG